MITEAPQKYKTLKAAYDSMKAQYNSLYKYDIIFDNEDILVEVTDRDNNHVGYLEDY
tara:strand:- start:1250 stop:1420 length:171 start_codon:yes stop_codon:yes gene_type:complete